MENAPSVWYTPGERMILPPPAAPDEPPAPEPPEPESPGPTPEALAEARTRRLGPIQAGALLRMAGGDLPDAARENGLRWYEGLEDDAWQEIESAKRAEALLLSQHAPEDVEAARQAAYQKGHFTLEDIPDFRDLSNPEQWESAKNALAAIEARRAYVVLAALWRKAPEQPTPSGIDHADDQRREQEWQSEMKQLDAAIKEAEPIASEIVAMARSDLENAAKNLDPKDPQHPQKQMAMLQSANSLTIDDLKNRGRLISDIQQYAENYATRRLNTPLPQLAAATEFAKAVGDGRLYTYNDLLGATPEDEIVAGQLRIHLNEQERAALSKERADLDAVLRNAHPESSMANQYLRQLLARARTEPRVFAAKGELSETPGAGRDDTSRGAEIAFEKALDRLGISPSAASILLGVGYARDIRELVERTNAIEVQRTVAAQPPKKWMGRPEFAEEAQNAIANQQEAEDRIRELAAQIERAAPRIAQIDTLLGPQIDETEVLTPVLNRLGT